MARRHQTNVRIEPELMAAMQGVREAEGVPVSVQIRRGIVMWLESKGVSPKKTERPRAVTRKRS